jgi:hypothetical protein
MSISSYTQKIFAKRSFPALEKVAGHSNVERVRCCGIVTRFLGVFVEAWTGAHRYNPSVPRSIHLRKIHWPIAEEFLLFFRGSFLGGIKPSFGVQRKKIVQTHLSPPIGERGCQPNNYIPIHLEFR